METNWIFIIGLFFLVVICFMGIYTPYHAEIKSREAEEAEKTLDEATVKLLNKEIKLWKIKIVYVLNISRYLYYLF